MQWCPLSSKTCLFKEKRLEDGLRLCVRGEQRAPGRHGAPAYRLCVLLYIHGERRLNVFARQPLLRERERRSEGRDIHQTLRDPDKLFLTFPLTDCSVN